MEHIKKILNLCNQINERRQILLDKDLNRYMLYPDSEKQAYRTIVELIQKLNNCGYFEDVKELYCELNKYIPDNDKKLKNVLLNEYEIAEGKTHLESFPRHIQLVMTLQCNLNCIMCNDKHENIFISDRELDDLIKIMPYMQFLTLRGGEVFFDKRVGFILDEAYKNGVKVSVVTNGLLLNEELIKKTLKTASGIIFSIDSPFEETYESIRIGSKFKNLINNLKQMKTLKSTVENNNVKIILNMVVMKRNYKQIENMLYFAKEYGFDAVTLSPMEGIEKSPEENFFENNADNSIIQEIANKREIYNNLSAKLGIFLENKIPNNIRYCDNIAGEDVNICVSDKKSEKNIKQLFCYGPFRQMFKLIDSCKPLCFCNDNNDILDDKNIDGNTILKCWNSRYMISYRKKMLMHDYSGCGNACLNANQDTFEGKKILFWEMI